MPYRIRWEGHGIYRHFFDVFTLAEFQDAYDEMRRDVRYPDIRYIISDYLEGQPASDITERELKAFAELEWLRFYDSPDTVQANVATDPKTVAYVKYYESLCISPHCMRHLATVAEARQWIASNPRLGWIRPAVSVMPAAAVPRG